MKILIVDDEKILSQSIARNLEQHGYHVDIAHSFSEYKKNDPLKYSIFIVDVSL
jgi:DNA-binding response OmpR family regulator